MNVNPNAITEGVIWKQLLIFFFPILLGTFFQQMYNTADAVVVGRFVGKEALAAVGGSTGVLINLMVGFFVGLSAGATVIIAQYYGAHNDREVGLAVHTAIALSLAGGAILTLAGLIGAPYALRAMGVPEDTFDYAVTYMRIYFGGVIATLIYNIGSAILRAVGDSRRPLYFLIVCCLTNIVLDVLFVVGFGWGIVGVGVATVVAQIVSAVLVILTLMRSQTAFRLYLRQIRFSGDILRRIIAIGLPTGLQSMTYSVSNMIIQQSVNTFGTDIVAAWAACGKIDGVYWMIINAFGVAITTFVGQNYGAGLYDRVRGSVRSCLLMASIATVIVSVSLYFACEPIYRLFTSDAVVIEKGVWVLRMLVPWYITYVCIEVLSGALRGAGNSVKPMIMNGLGICALRVLWVFLVVPRYNSMDTVVISYPISWVLTSALFIVYYLRCGIVKDRPAVKSGA